MILVIDNYDSFTYNLVQYLGELGAELRVRRNNEVTVDEIAGMKPATGSSSRRARAGPNPRV
jgi:anthranilate/para-aminobenzoate synthase component II